VTADREEDRADYTVGAWPVEVGAELGEQRGHGRSGPVPVVLQ